jgi:hypothetical protein
MYVMLPIREVADKSGVFLTGSHDTCGATQNEFRRGQQFAREDIPSEIRAPRARDVRNPEFAGDMLGDKAGG